MNTRQKVAIARQLARLNVDIIEAGFPASSDAEAEAVRAVARAVGSPDGPVICGLARATPPDIECCVRALEPAVRKRVHIFLATSDIHLEHKLRITRNEALDQAARAVSLARELCDDVQFSAEDAARSWAALLAFPRFLENETVADLLTRLLEATHHQAQVVVARRWGGVERRN